MELLITHILQALLFPPGGVILLLLLGLLLLRWRPLLAKTLLWSALLAGCLFSTPYIAGAMMRYLQIYPAIPPAQIEDRVRQSKAGAIVVLAANSYRNAPEYGRDTVGDATLERVRYGAFLYRHTDLPVVVSGGYVLDTTGKTLAAEMAQSLRDDFGVQDVWLEQRSHTTAENAMFTAQLLKAKGIDTVLLVTHAYHMPRAVWAFERSGLKVVPAPTKLSVPHDSNKPLILSWLPNARALYDSRLMLHELVGMAWYRLRY